MQEDNKRQKRSADEVDRPKRRRCSAHYLRDIGFEHLRMLFTLPMQAAADVLDVRAFSID